MDLVTNYWAVLVAGVAAMVVGFLWYGPLFGKAWAKEMGWANYSPEQMADMKKKAGKAYPQQLLGALIMAFVFAHIMFAFMLAMGKEPTIALGLQGAFWVWLGFIVTVKHGGVLWEGKSYKLFFIDTLYYLVLLAVMSIILVSWQ